MQREAMRGNHGVPGAELSGLRRVASAYDYILLFSAFLYLIGGNAARFRFVESLGLGRAVPITELLLVGTAILGAWRCIWVPRVLLRGSVITCGLVLLSALYGVVQFEFILFPVSYALRFVAQIVVSLSCGISLWRVFGKDSARLMRWVIAFYLIHCVLGLVLLAAFPQSPDLWQALDGIGITFVGDPHHLRFYSTYFDPNYMAVILVLPAVLSLCMMIRSGSWFYWGAFLLLAVCCILCFSRSGMATLFLSTAFVVWTERRKIFSQGWLAFRMALLIFTGVTIACTLFLLFNEQAVYFWTRSIGIANDESALIRYRSFENALVLWRDFPFFGVGYNYASLYTLATRGLTSEDSSLMNMLSNFGIVGCLFLFSVILISGWRLHRQFTLLPADSSVRALWLSFASYAVICVGFSAQFNNLLFYSFWLIPVLAIVAYLTIGLVMEKGNARGAAWGSRWRDGRAT